MQEGKSGYSVTVVIVNYNREKLLAACLESLMRQQDAEIEIVLVDNASTDGSVQMAISQYAQNQPFPLRIVRNHSNLGFCEANNRGIAIASGEFIALLNNDAEADPFWIRRLLTGFQTGEIGMAASKILVWENPRKIDKAGHLIYLDGQNRGRGSGELDVGQYDTMEEVLWPDGCAAMYRRSMLNEIGGFDEDFFAYADDAELGLRARIAGWRCVYVPQAVVRHHRGATLGVRSLRRVELIERNRVLLAAKLFPWSLLWLNGVFYGARLAAGMWAALTGKGEISRFPGWKHKIQVLISLIKADFEALTLLPKILRKRSTLIRRLNNRQILNLLWQYRITLKELSQQSI